MKKTILIYNDGTRAFAQGNIVVKTNKQVSEEIIVDGDEKITNAEFEEFALHPTKTGVDTFINKMRTESEVEENKKDLKGGGKADIIPEEVSGLPNKEKATTF